MADSDFPNRPDHPDFWRLSEIVLNFDSFASGQPSEQMFHEHVEQVIDQRSLSYLATQRAMRACGVVTSIDLLRVADDVARLAAIYLEAFLVGASFEKRGGRQ